MSAFRGEPKAPAIFLRTDSSQHWKGKARFARNGLDRAGDAPDDTALVDAPIQLDNNLPRPVIVDVLKFVNVTCTEKHRCQNGLSCEGKGSHTMLLHDLEELDDHLRYRTN